LIHKAARGASRYQKENVGWNGGAGNIPKPSSAGATTMAGRDHEVPFFLLPDLGGHDLRGFSDYRFRDRHSMNWTAESRWYLRDYLDAAIFYDAGKVASTAGSLDFQGLQSSVGAGMRLHTRRSTLLRLDVAHSREGLRLVIAFSPVGQ